MNKAILALALLICSTAHAIESDKKLHFGFSFVIGVAAVNQFPDNKLKAFGFALLPGLAKELSDAGSGGTGFSGKDMAANALGAAMGVYTGGWILSRTQGTTKVAYAATF